MDDRFSLAKYYSSQTSATPQGGAAGGVFAGSGATSSIVIQSSGNGSTVLGGTGVPTSYTATYGDSVQAGGGSDTVRLSGPGSALAQGASSVTGATTAASGGLDNMSFIASHFPSTVLGAAGSGNVTVYGADGLASTTGAASHVAASAGNETLIAGHGAATPADPHVASLLSISGNATVTAVADIVRGFDLPQFSGPGANDDPHTPSLKGGSLMLPDGTKLVGESAAHLSNMPHH